MLTGNTLFAGDSMTVGLSPFVTVDGQKRTIAEVGRTSAGLLAALRAVSLASTKNLVVLIGANDIGGTPPATTIANTRAIWALGRAAGAKVYAMTIPPNKGWSNFASNAAAIEARRKEVNAGLGDAFVKGEADGLIDLSTLMADSQDPAKLASSFDSGDHLHPRKDAHGALLTRAFGGVSPTPSPFGTPDLPPPSPPSPGDSMPLLLLVGVGGIMAYLLTRKRTLGWL